MNKTININWKELAIFGMYLCIAFFISFFTIHEISISNSFHYCADQSVYYKVAESWAAGILPYRDLFDHKGPLLYGIYLLGIILAPGKIGIFILTSITIGVSFFFAYKITKLFIKHRIGAVLITIFYICICSGLCSGSTEDFSLPFILIPLYYFIKHLTNDNNPASISWKLWALSGFSFGVHVLLRLNNAGMLCGCVLGIWLIILAKRNYLYLVKSALLFSLFSLIAITPFLAYFFKNGIISEFIECVFTFNFKYAARGVDAKTTTEWIQVFSYTLSFWIFLLSGTYLLRKRKLSKSVYITILTSSAAGAFCILPGHGYLHYFLICSPSIIFAITSTLLASKLVSNNKLKTVILTSLIICYVPFIGYSAYDFYRGSLAITPTKHPKHKHEYELKNVCEKIKQIIPPNERNSVLSYNGQGNIYLYLEANPPFRLFMLQSHLVHHVSEYMDEFNESMCGSHAPRWIIASNPEDALPALNNYITTRCEEIEIPQNNTNLKLYRKL